MLVSFLRLQCGQGLPFALDLHVPGVLQQDGLDVRDFIRRFEAFIQCPMRAPYLSRDTSSGREDV